LHVVQRETAVSDLVWLAALRRGISYHQMPDGERKTACGRWYGIITDGRPDRGYVMTEAEATTLGAAPCGTCWPDPEVRWLQRPVVHA
jgi:hypothetical protein